MSRPAAVLVLFAVLLLLYALMWRGWRRRVRKHDLPPLPQCTPGEPATLSAGARYFGSTVAGDWLDRVVARGLGTRSAARLELSGAGLDVVRDPGAFRIPAGAVRGARHDQGIAGKVVPPHGLMVVTWAYGGLLLDSGFRLVDGGTAAHETWVAAVSALARTEEETR